MKNRLDAKPPIPTITGLRLDIIGLRLDIVNIRLHEVKDNNSGVPTKTGYNINRYAAHA